MFADQFRANFQERDSFGVFYLKGKGNDFPSEKVELRESNRHDEVVAGKTGFVKFLFVPLQHFEGEDVTSVKIEYFGVHEFILGVRKTVIQVDLVLNTAIRRFPRGREL